MGNYCALGLLVSSLFTTQVGFLPDIDLVILRRGDANNDGIVNQTDAIFLNNFLFSGGPEPPCQNQADTNDDGIVDVSDSIYLLSWLFDGGSPPPAPGPYNTQCAEDSEPAPGCSVNPCN